jgi:hypothetical protein
MTDIVKGMVRWLCGLFVCPFLKHDWSGKGKEEGKHCARCGAWEYDR